MANDDVPPAEFDDSAGKKGAGKNQSKRSFGMSLPFFLRLWDFLTAGPFGIFGLIAFAIALTVVVLVLLFLIAGFFVVLGSAIGVVIAALVLIAAALIAGATALIVPAGLAWLCWLLNLLSEEPFLSNQTRKWTREAKQGY